MKLHPSSKRKIERLYNEWSYVIDNKDKIVRRQVSATTAKLFEKSGYGVNSKHQVFILVDPGDKVRIRDGFVIYERANGDTEKVILSARPDFLGQVERLKRRDLERNELLTLKVGEYRNVKTQFTSWDQLQRYVSTTQWKSDKVFQYLSVVKVAVDEPDEELEEGESLFQRRTDIDPEVRRAKAAQKAAKNKKSPGGRGY